MRFYVSDDDSRKVIDCENFDDAIQQLKGQWLADQTDLEYRLGFLERFQMWNGKDYTGIVRTDSNQNFIEDLITVGILTVDKE